MHLRQAVFLLWHNLRVGVGEACDMIASAGVAGLADSGSEGRDVFIAKRTERVLLGGLDFGGHQEELIGGVEEGSPPRPFRPLSDEGWKVRILVFSPHRWSGVGCLADGFATASVACIPTVGSGGVLSLG